MGKITKQQLSDGLLDYINEAVHSSNQQGPSTIVFKKNTSIISSIVDRVPIGIEGFDKTKDLLMVYKNNVYLEEGSMYSISEDSLYIINPDGDWNESGTSIFNFIVIKGSGMLLPDNETINIPDGYITEVKLHQNLKDTLNIGRPTTWDSLRT